MIKANIMMSSYQYRNPNVKDKTVSYDRLIINMGIPIPEKLRLYFETGPWFLAVTLPALIAPIFPGSR